MNSGHMTTLICTTSMKSRESYFLQKAIFANILKSLPDSLFCSHLFLAFRIRYKTFKTEIFKCNDFHKDFLNPFIPFVEISSNSKNNGDQVWSNRIFLSSTEIQLQFIRKRCEYQETYELLGILWAVKNAVDIWCCTKYLGSCKSPRFLWMTINTTDSWSPVNHFGFCKLWSILQIPGSLQITTNFVSYCKSYGWNLVSH